MRTAARSAIFELIDAERLRQESKHVGRTCASPYVDPFFKLTILAEEFGEVGRALLDNEPGDLRRELVQVAAVAVSWLECLSIEEDQ